MPDTTNPGTYRHRFTDSTRLHHLRQMLRNTERVANARSTVAQATREVAGANSVTLQWAIETIEHHRPDLTETKDNP